MSEVKRRAWAEMMKLEDKLLVLRELYDLQDANHPAGQVQTMQEITDIVIKIEQLKKLLGVI